jgi:hypothetical protein
MLAHGFTVEQLVELVRGRLATASAERVAIGRRSIESRRCGSRRRGGGRAHGTLIHRPGGSDVCRQLQVRSLSQSGPV